MVIAVKERCLYKLQQRQNTYLFLLLLQVLGENEAIIKSLWEEKTVDIF